MEHFYQKIQGWFDFDDIYKKMVFEAKDGARFVEIGCWKGRSAAFMCVEIANSKKNISFDCIDSWNGLGSVGEYDRDPSVIKNTLYEDFLKNMEQANGLYTAIKSLSHEASELYRDESLDFVFIDGGHEYSQVKKDITCWLPKIKKNGTIAGHDYSNSSDVRKAVNELVSGFYLNGASWLKKV